MYHIVGRHNGILCIRRDFVKSVTISLISQVSCVLVIPTSTNPGPNVLKAVVIILIYGGKVQKYVRGRKPKAAKKAAPKSPKPTRVQPKRSATPEPLSRKPSSPKKPAAKPAAKPRAASPAPAKKPAVKKSPARKPAAKKPATRKAAVSPKKPRGGSRATLEALASARSTPATRAELKTTLETLGVDFKSSDSTKYLQRKLEMWLEEN